MKGHQFTYFGLNCLQIVLKNKSTAEKETAQLLVVHRATLLV